MGKLVTFKFTINLVKGILSSKITRDEYLEELKKFPNVTYDKSKRTWDFIEHISISEFFDMDEDIKKGEKTRNYVLNPLFIKFNTPEVTIIESDSRPDLKPLMNWEKEQLDGLKVAISHVADYFRGYND